ncbi:MAG: putative Ig domain-containing protein, partial [bacterium]
MFIAGASLESGKDYLILYSASYGGSGTSTVPQVAVSYGGTIIANGADEGSSSGSPEAMRDGSLHGYYYLTADGNSDLRIQWSTLSGGGTSYIKGKSLIAIPLETLVEGQDYWYVQQNGAAAEVSTTSAFTDLLTTTANLPESGDYLVLMSAEGWTPSGSTSDGEQFRAVVNSTAQKAAMAKEWEDNNARRSFSYARVHNLSAGNNSFAIEVGSAQGTNSKSFGRGRIIIVRAGAFDQVVSSSQNSDFSTTANYPTYDNFVSQSYTPNQQEYVVVIGNTWSNQGTNARSVVSRLSNTTDASYFSDFIADDSKDINVDRAMLSVFGAEEISSSKSYALQVSGESSYTTAHHFQYGDLIVWSMTESSAANRLPVLEPIGPQSVSETENLNFLVSASDYESTPELTTSTLPFGASFVDHNDGTGTFDWTPDATQAGLYNVTFYATDDSAAVDSESVEITVFQGGPGVIARIGNWTTGLTHTVPAGDNRLLIFAVGYEDGTVSDPVAAVSYGGQALTRAGGDVAGTTFWGRAELWYLKEAGIQAASSNTFSVTWGSSTPTDPMYGAATYANVSQTSPIYDIDSNSTDAATPNPLTVSIDVAAYGVAVGNWFSGNNGSYTWNNGWSEAFDQTSGSTCTMSAADHAETAAGTVTASATHSGPNRQAAVALSLAPANAPPTITVPGAQSVAEGDNLNFGVSGTDLDGDSLILTAENLPTNATFADNYDGTGTVDFNPDFGQAGIYNVTFIVTDGVDSDTDQVQITVTDINQAPVITVPGAQSVAEGDNLNFGVSGTDLDGDSLIL